MGLAVAANGVAVETFAEGPPPPPPAIIEPLLYFEAGSVETIPQSEINWREIERWVADGRYPFVRVTAYADGERADGENLALARRRAERVAQRLAALPRPPAGITLVACGDPALPVPPRSGTAEPLNRLAWIDFLATPDPERRVRAGCEVYAFGG